MTGQSVVARVRATLLGIAVAQAGILAAAAALIFGWVGAAIVIAVSMWRFRHVRSLERAALWVEERDRTLQYELVTSVDPRYQGRDAHASPGPLLKRAATRQLWPAVLVLLVAFGARAGIDSMRQWLATTRDRRSDTTVKNRLSPLVASVVPPAYSHVPAFTVKEPAAITSLPGSAITFRGSGGWQSVASMSATATVVRLADGVASRLVVLTPLVDAPPTVELAAPERDSTLRTADAQLPLIARATDDFGLADGYFEIIITGGEEESGGVQGRTLTIGRSSLGDARTAMLRTTLAFNTLGLHPGDVISIRAIARDGNTVTGPGVGTSDTRTFRLATSQEYDSTTVTPAPPSAADSAYMTQRMIVLATQALLGRMRRRPPVARDTVVQGSARLADRQEALRTRVYELLTNSEAMPAAERLLFDTAYAAMTDASNNLEIADPGTALPHERRALGVLDSVRAMQRRYYLRGQPPTIVVNISRVRLTGTEKPNAGERTPALPSDSIARRLAVALSRVGGPAMADSLALMAVAAYHVSPELAGSLGQASAALRAGRDPAPALARARRLLDWSVSVDTGQTGWVAP